MKGEGIGRRRLVNRGDDFLILLRAGDREHVREARADDVGFLAHAAGDDDAAVLGDGFADRLEAFLLGAESRKPQVLTSTTSAPA